MDFTIDQISQQWYNLHNSTDLSVKKEADIFLRNFKKSPNCIDVCLQLFSTANQSNKIFACLILYQSIKENANILLTSKEKFNHIKNMIFTQIIPALDSCPPIVIERVCFSISILIVIGTVTYWQEGIEDIMQFASASTTNCYYSVIILSNFANELQDLALSQKMNYMIKDVLMDKNTEIFKFINFILTNANNVNDKAMFNKLYIKAIELAKNWITFEMNVLSNPQLIKMLIDNINSDNIESICDLFTAVLPYAKSAKLEASATDGLDELIAKTDKDEMTSVSYIIEVIIKYLSDNNKKDYNVLNSFAKVFSSISENYILLFFTKNDTSKKLLELFYFFISYRKRVISYKLFDSMSTMKTFINTEYKFSNYNNEEKVQFSNYLIKITEAIMLNCKMKHFENDDVMINQGKEGNVAIKFYNDIHSQESDMDDNEISISDYREYSEDVFFEIFTIFAQNFQNDGVNYFLESIMKILSNNNININDDSIVQNEHFLLITETVLFVIKSIIECFESMKLDPKPLILFTSFFLHSKAIQNSNFLIKFLFFIDATSFYISYDQTLYLEITNFIISIAFKSKQFTQLCCAIIENISEAAKVYNENVFKQLYKFYMDNYDSVETNEISNIAEALCASSAVTDTNTNNLVQGMDYDTLLKMFVEITEPATQRIKIVCDLIVNNNYLDKIDKVKYEIMKNYLIHTKVMKRAFLLGNEQFFKVFFQNHFDATYNYSNIIFNLFKSTDSEIIDAITNIYIKSTQKKNFMPNSEDVFDKLHNMMISAYSANGNNYKCLSVLKNLYSNYLVSVINRESPVNEKKEKDITLTFLNLMRVIPSNIVSLKSNQIESIESFAQLFNTVYDKLNLSYVLMTDANNVITILNGVMSLFSEAISTIAENSLINNILKAFSVYIKSTSKEIVNIKYNDIMTNVFLAIDHFSPMTINTFVIFVIECMKYDQDAFSSNLRRILTSSECFNMFKKEHIDLILDYLTSNVTNDRSVKSILNDIVNIEKGMGQLDSLNHYGIEMMRKKITSKAK